MKSKIIKDDEQIDVVSVDLINQDHRLAALQSIIENVGHQFELLAKSAFQALLRQSIDFKLIEQRTQNINSYLNQLAKPSVYREFMVSPHDLHSMVAIDGEILFRMVDVFFGGTGKGTTRKPVFSDTELRLVERFFSTLLNQFSSSWHSVADWECELFSKCTLNLFHPNKPDPAYQVCCFAITIGNTPAGWLEIALPVAGLDFLRDTSVLSSDAELIMDAQERIAQKVYGAPVKLSVTLAEKRMKLGQVMDLKLGDIVPIELPEQVIAKAGSTALFKARVAENNASLVLQVQEIINT